MAVKSSVITQIKTFPCSLLHLLVNASAFTPANSFHAAFDLFRVSWLPNKSSRVMLAARTQQSSHYQPTTSKRATIVRIPRHPTPSQWRTSNSFCSEKREAQTMGDRGMRLTSRERMLIGKWKRSVSIQLNICHSGPDTPGNHLHLAMCLGERN